MRYCLDDLLDFVHEYQKTQEPETLLKILMVVDKFLVHVSFDLKEHFWWKNIPLQELYQICIVSVPPAILSAKPSWKSIGSILYRIRQYSKRCLKTEYKKIRKKPKFFIDYETPESVLSKYELFEDIFNLIIEQKIQYVDFLIVVLHKCYDVSLKELSFVLGINYYKLYRRFKRGLFDLQENLNSEDYIWYEQ